MKNPEQCNQCSNPRVYDIVYDGAGWSSCAQADHILEVVKTAGGDDPDEVEEHQIEITLPVADGQEIPIPDLITPFNSAASCQYKYTCYSKPVYQIACQDGDHQLYFYSCGSPYCLPSVLDVIKKLTNDGRLAKSLLKIEQIALLPDQIARLARRKELEEADRVRKELRQESQDLANILKGKTLKNFIIHEDCWELVITNGHRGDLQQEYSFKIKPLDSKNLIFAHQMQHPEISKVLSFGK